jgi:CRISPR/Cas system-associated endonuclease Cas1
MKTKKRTVLIRFTFEGRDAGKAEDVVNRLLDAGELQSEIQTAADDRGIKFEITNAEVCW